jgi:lipoprotein-releasing system permease protein
LNFPLFIARRYIVAKKSHNAINVIAAISILGITGGTIAFILVLSVFNGFDFVVRDLFNSFYADLEIVPIEGKTFLIDSNRIEQIKGMDNVLNVGTILEDNALLIYGDKQTIGTVRGVSPNYSAITGMDTMMYEGSFILSENNIPMAVVGRGIKYYLNIGLDFIDNLKILVPTHTEHISMDPNRSLNSRIIRPSGIFTSQPEIEAKYVIVPIAFAQSLFERQGCISAYEIQLKPGTNESRIQKEIQNIIGNKFLVKNRIQQNELLYKTMKTEKWAIFFILAFILIVTSFNVVGSLTMLIIEKKNDIQTLRNLGLNMISIKKTFLYQGLLISLVGAIIGLIIGTMICLLQQKYGFVRLPGDGSFVISAYPVQLIWSDILLVLFTVSLIGFIASWYPIRFITRRFLTDANLV